jgi:ribosome maturation factor RimP
MLDRNTIEQYLEGMLTGEDIFLVGVKVDNKNRIVLYIDTPEGISIDDCARVSRQLEDKLDRDREDFALEVSSPGLDAPFRVIQQYQKNIGKKISIVKAGGEKLEGILTALDEKGIVLEVIKNKKSRRAEQSAIALSFGEIKSARASISF